MSLSDKLAHERRGRLAAERLLELKQAELFSANAKLGEHALALSDQIVEQRQETAFFRGEAAVLKDENSQVRSHLETAEQRLWDSIQTIHDGFAVFDSNSCLITANDSFIALFDGLDEVRNGVNYGRVLELLAEEGTVDIGTRLSAEWQAEMLERWLGTDLPPLTIKLWDQRFIRLIDRRAANGDTVTLALDITEATQREEDLKDARNRAEAASRAKSSFLANMSHELRTPMNGVVGMAELLLDSPLDEEQQLYVDTIKGSGEALLVIINDVLDYSRADAGKLQLHPETFNLHKTVVEICTLLGPTATEKGLTLTFDYEDGLPTGFVADPGRVRQILINLLGNAIKFTLEGSVALRIAGFETTTPEQIIIRAEIEDTGIGIHEDQLDHIFGEFNQAEVEHNRKFDGTGLGLAITRELIHLMGGEIWVDSVLGQGSCFGFKLPLPVSEAVEEAATAPAPQTSAGTDAKADPEPETRVRPGPANDTPAQAVPDNTADAPAGACGAVDLPAPGIVSEMAATATGGTETKNAALSPDVPAAANRETDVDADSGTIAEAVVGDADTEIVPAAPPSEVPACVVPGPVAAASDPVDTATAPEQIADPAPEPPANLAANLTADLAADLASGLRKMRVLAAEDNKTNRLVFGKMVKTLTIDLKFAENGLEAVELWRSFEPDLVFMDISMPIMDGKQATAEIRRLEHEAGKPPVRVIAVTAHAMDGDDKAILAAGISHYLTKPLRKALIHEQIYGAFPTGCEILEPGAE